MGDPISDGIDIFAVQELAVFFGGEGLGISEFLARRQVGVPNVTDRGDANAGNPRQRFHEYARPAPGADAADRNRFVGGISAGGAEIPAHRRITQIFEKLSAIRCHIMSFR